MIVISGALATQLLSDVSTAAHKARWLLDQSLLATPLVDVRLREESAHVCLRQLC